MGKVHDEITSELKEFILAQSLFFTGTAPLSATGHVNVSPKGLNTFRVLSPRTVAYLDLTGSGNETAAHLIENGRIVFMFCSFAAKPQILRLHGKGRVILPDAEEWQSLWSHFPTLAGARQIIFADIHRVQTSCGFGVPLLHHGSERDALIKWARNKGDPGLEEYRRTKNATSIDGLPATENPI
jgi:hypothetical protein